MTGYWLTCSPDYSIWSTVNGIVLLKFMIESYFQRFFQKRKGRFLWLIQTLHAHNGRQSTIFSFISLLLAQNRLLPFIVARSVLKLD